MSIGYETYCNLKKVEKRANLLGFKFGPPKYGNITGEGDVISLYPIDDCLPLYSRDAEIKSGDLYNISAFITGIEWSMQYLDMLKLKPVTNIAKAEQLYRNRQLVNTLKNEV